MSMTQSPHHAVNLSRREVEEIEVLITELTRLDSQLSEMYLGPIVLLSVDEDKALGQLVQNDRLEWHFVPESELE